MGTNIQIDKSQIAISGLTGSTRLGWQLLYISPVAIASNDCYYRTFASRNDKELMISCDSAPLYFSSISLFVALPVSSPTSHMCILAIHYKMLLLPSSSLLKLYLPGWPNSARAELKRKLGILWIRLGLIWKSDPLSKISLLQDSISQSQYIGLQEEQNLAKSCLKLRDLIAQAGKEFRLKGQYPIQQYNVIIGVTEEILDAYHNVNTMIRRATKSSELDTDIIRYTELERKELGNRIFLLFYLLSSALRLGLPLPDHLPNTEHARERMIAKVNEFRLKQVSDVRIGNEDEFVLFYSFILATLSINEGLLHIIAMQQQIYGTIEDETLAI
ncbi:hypothetical protein V1523DRAFT_424571 [Lipomyces doorenjongii]